jgi:hypothetical protein
VGDTLQFAFSFSQISEEVTPAPGVHNFSGLKNDGLFEF